MANWGKVYEVLHCYGCSRVLQGEISFLIAILTLFSRLASIFRLFLTVKSF